MDLIEVTPSGSVGKQVYAISDNHIMLESVIVNPGVSAATVVVREGGAAAASGEVKLTLTCLANDSSQFDTGCKKFTRGLHVTVTPANAKAYLLVK